jgi:hypothetical protein
MSVGHEDEEVGVHITTIPSWSESLSFMGGIPKNIYSSI